MKEPKPDLYVKDIDGNYHRYEQEQNEPVAITTGIYGGRFTYVTNKPNVILPDGMALFATPQQPTIDKSAAIRIATALGWAPPKQEQGEPVAYDVRCDNCGGDGYDPKDNNYSCSICEGSKFLEKLLYTTPQPKREPLTDDEIDNVVSSLTVSSDGCIRFSANLRDFARAIEAAHGIKENA